jgi:predicted CXXCH cytochrome family protein
VKNLTVIFSAVTLCLAAVTAGSAQTQEMTPGDVPAGSSASDQSESWNETFIDSADPIVLKLYEYSKPYKEDAMHDPARDVQSLDWNEIPIFTQFVRQATTHPLYPGLDHHHSSHEVVSSSPDGAIDTCSLACLSCHDGINASETRVKTVGEWQVSLDFDQTSHPLGIDYDKALFRNSGLKPSAFLPSEIILPEGKVGCESCHNLYSTMPYFLVVSNQGSALCLGCHAK